MRWSEFRSAFCRLVLGAGAAVLLAARSLPAAAPPPNVVLIISDDHAWGDYGFMGHPHVKTPHLDRLAQASLSFTRGYVPSSLCRASLASILTGLYPHQHKITSNDPPLPPAGQGPAEKNATFLAQRQAMIDYVDQVPTLPRLLGKLGYRSLQTGKWWEGDFKRGGFTHGMSQGGRHGDQGLNVGRQTMQPVYDFIDESVRAEKPFLVWYAPMMPHTPHNPPERLLERYRPLAPSLPVARYWAMIEWFDETCGALLKFLDDRKLAENTLVVYVADNGWIQQPQGNGYAPRSKQSPYEGGLRTPILLRFPGRIEPRASEALASSLDLAPTILAAAGVTPSATPPTKSQAAADSKPAAVGPGLNLLDRTSVEERRTLFGECFEHNAVDIRRPATSLKFRWCIDGHLKLILPQPARVPQAAVELFDLSQDPHELKNLAADRPADVARLRERIEAWWSAKE